MPGERRRLGHRRGTGDEVERTNEAVQIRHQAREMARRHPCPPPTSVSADSCCSSRGKASAAAAPRKNVAMRGSAPPSRSTRAAKRSEEHTSELQSLMRISYAAFCLKKKHEINNHL